MYDENHSHFILYDSEQKQFFEMISVLKSELIKKIINETKDTDDFEIPLINLFSGGKSNMIDIVQDLVENSICYFIKVFNFFKHSASFIYKCKFIFLLICQYSFLMF